MRLHAHSINLWASVPCTHWVAIEDTAFSYNQWLDHLSPLYTKHKLKLLTDVCPSTNVVHPRSGWLRQQLIKLLVSKYINGDNYLILDSKNFFIKSFDLNQWPIAQGNNIIDNIRFNWPELNSLLAENNISQPVTSWSVTTPFRVKKSIINKMLDLDLEKIILNPINRWASEFLLYSIIAQIEGESIESGFATNLTFWDDDSRLHNVADLDDIYNWPQISSLGIHHQLLNKNIDFSALINWLNNKGLDRNILEQCLI
jgi:hypothetical protein